MEPPPTLSSRPFSLPSSPRHRPALRPGSLQRLLRPPDPDADDDDSAATPRSRSRAHGHARDRVLLQVTNITPALSDAADPFSGHHGFYLRLSDSSRSCYVSLHADHDDLILANGLHIGQIIEVERLVPAVPVPVLRQFRVLPGRYPCAVQQQDSGDDEVKEVVSERSRRPSSPTHPLPERRARQAGSPAAIDVHHYRSRSTTNLSEAGSPAAAAIRRESERRLLESPRSPRTTSVVPAVDATSSDDDEADVLSSLSTARRNWDFTGSIKDVRPVAPRRRSNSISPGKSGPNPTSHKNEAANDPLESVRRKAEKAFKVLSKRNAHSSSNTPRESLCFAVTTPQSASSSGIKWCEDNVVWDSLSSSLVKHGKLAMKQRDMALQAVLDGLLEASASEKLIKCLSKYSELQSDKDDDPKELIDRFLRVSQDLDHAIFIAQSQTRLRQQGKACCSSDPASSASAKAATKAALDRKQSVISWIRSAIEADLSSLPAGHTRATSESAKASVVESTKPASPLFRSKPKCNCSSRPSKKTADAFSTDGSNLKNAAMDLAVAMRSDCNRWFLKYIDKFLDDIESETTGYMACDSQVAGFLQQLKKVDDWLNRVVRHEGMFTIDRGNKDSTVHSEEDESDACERVRRKIYTALLRHVQFAAMALESSISSATDEEKEQE